MKVLYIVSMLFFSWLSFADLEVNHCPRLINLPPEGEIRAGCDIEVYDSHIEVPPHCTIMMVIEEQKGNTLEIKHEFYSDDHCPIILTTPSHSA